MKNILSIKLGFDSLKIFLGLSLLTGVVFPFFILIVAQVLLPEAANGSLIKDKSGKIIGSQLIAQKFERPEYFWSRPSASDHGTFPSGASNLGPTSDNLKNKIFERKAIFHDLSIYNQEIPAELLLASGSGLDPHLSPQGIQFQMPRIVKARNFSSEQTNQLQELIRSLTERPQGGFLGPARINVLLLNLSLDELK